MRARFRGRPADVAATAADVRRVVAVVFGLAGSVATGVLQVRAGLGAVFGLPKSDWIALAVLAVLFAACMISASTGVAQGIRLLSDRDMAPILGFVSLVGPTCSRPSSTASAPTPALRRGRLPPPPLRRAEGVVRELDAHLPDPMAHQGAFRRRLHRPHLRGRTIREFCAGVILAPTLLSVLRVSTFGGPPSTSNSRAGRPFGSGGRGCRRRHHRRFDCFPLSDVPAIGALALSFVFLVTSADSAAFVLSVFTTRGDPDLPVGASRSGACWSS